MNFNKNLLHNFRDNAKNCILMHCSMKENIHIFLSDYHSNDKVGNVPQDPQKQKLILTNYNRQFKSVT